MKIEFRVDQEAIKGLDDEDLIIIDGFEPKKAHNEDAGFDLFTPKDFILAPESTFFVDTMVHVAIPEGYTGFIKTKSGLMIKGLFTEGVIDAGYDGAIGIKMFNHSYNKYAFKRGDKIAQLVILPIPEVEFEKVDQFSKTYERGEGGFGSTGR